MPVLHESEFTSPFWLINKHWETIIPAMIRNPRPLNYSRVRIDTRDGDFLDLDFSKGGNNKIVILSHGLEGNSDKAYIRGMALHFQANGWDILAWNCRSCSGEINRKPKLYHHGATEDLEDVIQYTLSLEYTSIVLVGFSLGGSLVVKYLGENSASVPEQIKCGVAIAVPYQLGDCAEELSRKDNEVYLNRFLRKLKEKIAVKAVQYPDQFDVSELDQVRSFLELDSMITAPLYNFDSAEAFYHYASAGNYIKEIQTPVLGVNALNDPMFPKSCYPIEAASEHPFFTLEMPRRGGHMGFWWPGRKLSWIEERTLYFVNEIVG